MVHPVQRQAAYVLHRRAYRETSAIVDLLTRDHGRVAGVVRGARGSRNARHIEPFTRFEVSWRGRGQLVTVTSAESGERIELTGNRLFAGLYLNEVLVRSLREEDAMPRLFDAYEFALRSLEIDEELEPALRRFEKALLRELGYELACDFDAESGEPMVADLHYRFVEGAGFCRTSSDDKAGFSGEILILIERDQYERADVKRSAKRLLRMALRPHVGEKPFASRALFAGISGT